MKRNEYGLEAQPAPPKRPAEYPTGAKAMILLAPRAFEVGTVVRVDCVPGGAFVTLALGGGHVATLRPEFLRPVPRDTR